MTSGVEGRYLAMGLHVVFETHAITTANERGIATGWLPGRLSARGRGAARELGLRRADDGLAAIYVSDLARALETVKAAFPCGPIPTVVDPRLRECNYGELNGMPMERLEGERVGTYRRQPRREKSLDGHARRLPILAAQL
jgi:broad specificity phosphatase PhoE